jgi:N-acyl amino acid synthase of PEP-CTERM/exosortase system
MSTPFPPEVNFAPCFHSTHVQADDTALLQAVHRLRFEVYCRERAFLPEDDYPEQLEYDAYDASAAHFAAFNADEELVGYVRLVRPDAGLRLPFQSRCSVLTPGVQMPPAAESVEISRLMVRSDYRRRRGDLLAGAAAPMDGASVNERRRPSPQIMLSLYRAIFAYSLDAGLRYWFAAMEPPLARALMHMGFAFSQVGAAADYFGMVTPYLADLRLLEDRVGTLNPDLMRWLRQREPARR